MKVASVVALAVIVVFVGIDLADLVRYLARPDSYTFGTEVAGFRYTSPLHFLGCIAATIVAGAVALLLPRFLGSATKGAVLRVVIAAVLLGGSVWSVLEQ